MASNDAFMPKMKAFMPKIMAMLKGKATPEEADESSDDDDDVPDATETA